MKNLMLNQRIVNLIVIAFFTMLFAGCAVAPKAENVSMATTAAHIRADFADDLQPNPSDSPEFTAWGWDGGD
jgi:PBP1b-binding outer membrane lipoprotein LpoB